ncbi:MAG TPA: four helix bundle protein [Planctomycetota bacterium]|nr:four helix bundle protein [Planctomycetota bacterium]
MEDSNPDLMQRTRDYACRIIRLYCALPKRTEAQVVGKQLLRAGTSVGAHVREGKRSRSDAEMLSKTGGALQELEETAYWLELLVDAKIMEAQRLSDLMKETDELLAILMSSTKTIKKRIRQNKES